MDHGILLLSQQADASLDALRHTFEDCAPKLSVTACQATRRQPSNAFLAAASAAGIRLAFMEYAQPVAVSGFLDQHGLLFFTCPTPLRRGRKVQIVSAFEPLFLFPGECIDVLLPGAAPHFLVSLDSRDAGIESLDLLFRAQRDNPSEAVARELGAIFQDYMTMLKYAGSYRSIRDATARLKSGPAVSMADHAHGNYRFSIAPREIDPRLIIVSDFIEQQRRWDYHAQQLCKMAGMSLRGLYYGFEAAFQTTPYRFYRSCKLARVRLALLTDLYQDRSIAWHASNEGFFHLSRFSTQYRLQFGELPSETVRQVRQRVRHGSDQPRRENGVPRASCSDSECLLWRYCQLGMPLPKHHDRSDLGAGI